MSESESRVKQTYLLHQIDLIAPAVGNLHDMFKDASNSKLNIDLIAQIKQQTNTPIVLHGDSGTTDPDFTNAIKAGVSIIHINTKIRFAFKQALEQSLQNNPQELSL